jgi:hypothetical protein
MPTPLDPRLPTRSPEHIERLIGDILKDQPLRAAPRTLEQSVLAKIASREAMPWWRNSFLHWPLAARMLFVLLCLGLVKLAVTGARMLVAGVQSQPVVETIAKPLSWAETTAGLFSKTIQLAAIVLNAIPSHWLYIGLALAATLYIALLVLGATAYRTLYVNK